MPKKLKNPIVLDKSYLQGTPQREIDILFSNYRVLMLSVLFEELMTTENHKGRVRCFRKLPKIENPVDLIPNVGTLMRFEIKHRRPCTPIEERREKIRFVFNPQLKEYDFTFTPEQEKTIGDGVRQRLDDLNRYKEKCASVVGWLPELEKYVPGQPSDKIEEAIRDVVKDHKIAQQAYARIKPEDWPGSEMINEDWVLFRKMQVELIYALNYVRKYGPWNDKVESKEMLNDVYDIEYCISAVLAGNLACKDQGIIEVYKMLRPDGVLIN